MTTGSSKGGDMLGRLRMVGGREYSRRWAIEANSGDRGAIRRRIMRKDRVSSFKSEGNAPRNKETDGKETKNFARSPFLPIRFTCVCSGIFGLNSRPASLLKRRSELGVCIRVYAAVSWPAPPGRIVLGLTERVSRDPGSESRLSLPVP